MVAQLIIQRFFYTVTFIAALVVYCVAIAAGALVFCASGAAMMLLATARDPSPALRAPADYQYWHVEVLASIEVREGVAEAEAEEERWKEERQRAAAQVRIARIFGAAA